MIPFPTVLRRRSSWPSSFVTALIGWNGLATVAALAFGRAAMWPPLLPIATASACVQVPALRLRLRFAPSADSLVCGALAGAVSALGLAVIALASVPELARDPAVALTTAAYIGAPVGAFLAYFRRDDARIEDAARRAGRPVDYGRDAHWLDPFVYGALAFLAVCWPRTPAWAVSVAVVGAMVGVVAAGVSHFFLARTAGRPRAAPLAAAVGAPLGLLVGLALRPGIAGPLPAAAAGAIAGALCFAVTAAIGRRLAARAQGERT
jgi:hypothetical protein